MANELGKWTDGNKVATLGKDLRNLVVQDIGAAYAEAAAELSESMKKLKQDPILWSKTAGKTVTDKSDIAVTTLHQS